jgi:hypothetical protein
MTVKAICFSPTHTTKDILKEIFARLAGVGTFYDVTTPGGGKFLWCFPPVTFSS